jgi:hypothetical protein
MSDFYRRLFHLTLLPLLLALVSMTLSAQPIKLSVEPVADTNLAQQWPGIFVRGSSVYLTWGEVRPDPASANGALTFSLAEWPAKNVGPATVISTFRPDTLTVDPNPPTFVFGFGHVEQPQSFDGGVMVASSHWRDDLMRDPPNDIIHKGRFTMYVARPGSWGSTKIFEDQKHGTQVAVALKGHGYNADVGEFLSAWTSGEATNGTVTAVNPSGDIAWSVPNIPMEGRVVDLLAIGTRDFVAISDTVGRRYRDGNAVGAFKLPHVDVPRYFRLRDSTFLRVYTDTGLTHVTLDHYNLSGTLLATRNVLEGRASASLFVAQDRSNGELAVLAGGPTGLYVSHLDEILSGASDPVKVNVSSDSTNAPAAAFVGDSLFVIWQEYHEGTVDIWGLGSQVRDPDPVGVEEEGVAASGLAIASVMPNPARDVAFVDLTVGGSVPVALDLVDQLGRVVSHQTRGRFDSGRMELRLGGIAPGAYVIVARAGGRVATSKLMVIR